MTFHPDNIELVFTVAMCVALVAGAGLALLALPWTDAEVTRVADGFRGLTVRRRPHPGALFLPARAL